MAKKKKAGEESCKKIERAKLQGRSMCVFVGAQDSLGLLEPFNGDMTDKAQSTAQANCGLESDTSHSAQIFQGDKTR